MDDPPVRRIRVGGGVERALPLPARARTDRAVGRVRPPDPTRLRLGRPGRRGRGRPHRCRDRLDRGHGAAARRHPARRGLDLDDDQRPGRTPARVVRTGRRRAGRAGQRAPRHGAERHPQGVHRARATTSSRRGRRCGSRPICSPTARNGCRAGTRSRSPATTSARRARTRRRSSPSRSRTGSPTARPRSQPGSRPTRSAPGSRSSSTRTTTSSRRSRSSAPPARLWAQIMRDRFGATSAKAQALRFHAQTGGSHPHRAAAREQHRARRGPGAVRSVRRRAVAPHEQLRRGAGATDRARRDDRAPHPADPDARSRYDRHGRSARRLATTSKRSLPSSSRRRAS